MINIFECIVTNKAKQYVNEVLDSTDLNQGKYTDLFEEKLKQEWGLTNSLTLNSCTSGLFLALKLAGIGQGDEVLLPAQTFIATGLAVLMVNGIPRFTDIDHNGNISLDSIRLKTSNKTKAIIVVHWGGIPSDLKEIYRYCLSHNLKLIEDAAHGFGATYRNSIIGDCKYSDFCTFSTQSIKSLTTGDGGILCCKSEEDKEKAIRLRWFGMSKKNVQRGPNGNRIGDISEIGYKFHQNNINSAIGLGNLDGLRERLEVKYRRAMRYNTELFGLDGITLPIVGYPCKPSYWLYTIKADRRDDLIKKLSENGIQASTVDTRIDVNSVFCGNTEQKAQYLPGQEWFDKNQLSVPCTSSMTDDDQTKILSIIKSGW
jgi:dTDP-4-amino-4,6-dideoxygalactose transaminase